MVRVNAVIRCEDYIHFRPACILQQVCDLFPKTTFALRRADSVQASRRIVDPKSMLKLSAACLIDGESLDVTAEGESEEMAAALLKGLLENMNLVYSNERSSAASLRDGLADLLTRIAAQSPDPGRHSVIKLVDQQIRRHPSANPTLPPSPRSHRMEVPVSANLHGAVVEMFPHISRFYACEISLRYRHPVAGEVQFNLSGNNTLEILASTPTVGTVVTIEAHGEKCEAACTLFAAMLRNLARVDAWIRTSYLSNRSDSAVVDGIARLEASSHQDDARVDDIPETRVFNLNDLLMKEFLIIDEAINTKDEAVDRLVSLVHAHSGMSANDLGELVHLWSDRVNVCSDGFAYVHARGEQCPGVTLALGVFRRGIKWPEQADPKFIVALIVAATDITNTFMGYVGRLLGIFRHNRPLVDELTSAPNVSGVVRILKQADTNARESRDSQLARPQRRLLLVESLEDEMTRLRHSTLAASPRIRDYDIQYVYAIGEDGRTGTRLDKQEFAARLRARIAEIAPHFVLFHTGYVFREHAIWFQELMRDLRSRFVDVRFGYQRKPGLALDEDLSIMDGETEKVQTMLFRDVLGI